SPPRSDRRTIAVVLLCFEALARQFFLTLAGGVLAEGVAPPHVMQIADYGHGDQDKRDGENSAEKEVEQKEERPGQRQQQGERQGSFAVLVGTWFLHRSFWRARFLGATATNIVQ